MFTYNLEHADWWNPILQGSLRVDRGMALVDASPGSSVAWNEKAVTRFMA